MRGMFSGFSADAFAWFAGLERDNSKAYFTASREVYETQVREPLEELLEELAAEFGGVVKMFRQNRDVRFSPDKSPYKTTTYGILYEVTVPGDGLYAQLSARGLYAGTGYYRMARDQLERYREAVAGDAGAGLEEATAAAEAAGLELAGDSVKTAPRGYPRDHARIELLRRKELVAGRAAPGDGGLDRDAALAHVAGTWRAAEPINAWLDAQVGPSRLPPEERWGRR